MAGWESSRRGSKGSGVLKVLAGQNVQTPGKFSCGGFIGNQHSFTEASTPRTPSSLLLEDRPDLCVEASRSSYERTDVRALETLGCAWWGGLARTAAGQAGKNAWLAR